MKIKKHLVAATLAVGLAGSAGAMAPAGDSMSAQVGYVVVSHYANSGDSAAGTAVGSAFGAVVGKRVGMLVGARVGATVGSLFGPAGIVAGAAIGAL